MKKSLLILTFIGIANALFSQPGTLDKTNCIPGTIGGGVDVSASGAATYSLPIQVSPGSHGMQPNLSIVYSSQSGNGLLGWGCNLAGFSSISRVSKINYYDNTFDAVSLTNLDAFTLDGVRLINSSSDPLNPSTTYYPSNNPYTKVVFNTTNFTVTTQDGVVMEYGKEGNSLVYTMNGSVPISYAISRITDPQGNYIQFIYEGSSASGEFRISEIKYTGNSISGKAPYNSIMFYYESRPDGNALYVAGGKVNQSVRLTSIKAFCEGTLSKNYLFTYGFDLYSKLTSISLEADGVKYNPTYINWGATASYTPIGSALQLGSLRDYQLYSGDFNGDGRVDIAKWNRASWNGSNAGTMQVNIAQSGGGTISQTFSLISGFIAPNYAHYTVIISDIKIIDRNGDGNDDILVHFMVKNNDFVAQNSIIQPNTTQLGIADSESSSQAVQSNLATSVVSSHKGDIEPNFARTPVNSTAWEDYVYKYSLVNGIFVNENACQYLDAQNYNFFYGDVNSDGINEMLTVRNGNLIGCSDLTITIPTAPLYVVDMQFIDFDGDGRTDILSLYSDGHGSIWEYNGNTFVNRYGNGLTTFIGLPKSTFFGDFNGDGKTDYLTYVSNAWHLYYSTGSSFVEGSAPSLLNINPQTTGTLKTNTTFNPASTICVDDINSDGKADICQAVDGSVSIFLSNGNGFTNVGTYSDQTRDISNAGISLQSIDINNDGQKELIYGNDQYTTAGVHLNPAYYQIGFNVPLVKKYYVDNITDGLSNVFTFTYASFTDNRIFDALFPKPALPLMLVRGPWQLVSQLTRTSAGTSPSTTTYAYLNGYSHIGGLGFLGFKSATASNTPSGIISTSSLEYTIPGMPTVYSPWLSLMVTKKGTIALSTQTTSVTVLGGDPARKLFRTVVLGSTSTNHLKNITTSTTNTYDASLGQLIGQTVSAGEWTITTGYTYTAVPEGGSRLSSTTVSKSNSSDNHTVVTTLGYTGVRTLNRIVQAPGATTEYTIFDSYGNPKEVKVTSGGITRKTSCNYDDKGRFVVQSTDVLGNTSSADYRHSDGAKLWDENSLGNRTTYSYSVSNGAMVAVVNSPDGSTITSTLGWDLTGAGMYFTQKKLNSTAMQSVFFNSLGQKVNEQTAGYQNLTHSVDFAYNPDGTLATENISGVMTPTTYSYTGDGRLQSVIGHNTSISYSYSGRSETIFNNKSGVDQTKFFDALGYVKTVSGKMGTITYTYKATGAVKEIQAAGGTTRMEYDDLGNQTKLEDPDAGRVIYAYSGFNQLTSQTDAKGQTITCSYDAKGLLTSKSGPTTSESYVYNQTTGKFGQLLSATRNGITETYTYDNMGRLLTIVTGGGGQTFTTTLEYNSIGQLYRVTQPTGIILEYEYEGAGFLRYIYGYNQSNGTKSLVWQGVSQNLRGQWECFKLGNNLITKWGYNETTYMLESIKTGTSVRETMVQDLGFTFDANGQLSKRTDGLLSEIFRYDDKNRLTSSKVNEKGWVTCSYIDNGNISSTSIAGTYNYAATPIHAVSSVDGPLNSSGYSPKDSTFCHYTDDNRIADMDNGTSKNSFTYGPSGNRFKVNHFKSNNLVYSKIYVGNNEFILDNAGNITKSRTLIYAPTGICAVWEKEGIADTIHYVHTDYLGSWLKITDKNGIQENSYSYDAWGRPRNPYTWDLLPVSITNALANLSAMQPRFDRGYTGHEHMAGFGLINMNGRLYDPYLQRFLSPDNYVQNPLNAQNFNRYAYCLNNPLMYTDPSGWSTQLSLMSIYNNIAKYSNGTEFKSTEINFVASSALDRFEYNLFPQSGGGGMQIPYEAIAMEGEIANLNIYGTRSPLIHKGEGDNPGANGTTIGQRIKLKLQDGNEFNKDKAVKDLLANAVSSYKDPNYKHICLTNIYHSLKVGITMKNGTPFPSPPTSQLAKDLGPILVNLGFKPIVNTDNYSPLLGDIVVFNGNDFHKIGHDEMWCGSQWSSDMLQGDLPVYQSFTQGGAGFSPYGSNTPTFTIYRW